METLAIQMEELMQEQDPHQIQVVLEVVVLEDLVAMVVKVDLVVLMVDPVVLVDLEVMVEIAQVVIPVVEAVEDQADLVEVAVDMEELHFQHQEMLVLQELPELLVVELKEAMKLMPI